MLSIIEEIVCKVYDLSPGDIFERKTRRMKIVGKRQLFFYLSLKYSGVTQEAIGAYCTKYNVKAFDHTTVRHAFEKIKVEAEIYADIKNIITQCVVLLNNDERIEYDDKKLIYKKIDDNIENMPIRSLEEMIDAHINHIEIIQEVYERRTGERYAPGYEGKNIFSYSQTIV